MSSTAAAAARHGRMRPAAEAAGSGAAAGSPARSWLASACRRSRSLSRKYGFTSGEPWARPSSRFKLRSKNPSAMESPRLPCCARTARERLQHPRERALRSLHHRLGGFRAALFLRADLRERPLIHVLADEHALVVLGKLR